MHIYFERSGGFAGLRLQTTVDVGALPEDEARSLQAALEETRFFELPTDLRSGSGVDDFCYKLTVDTDGQQHTVHVSDQDAPPELRPLLRRLTLMAKRPSPESGSSEESFM